MSVAPAFPSTAKLLWTQTVYQLRSFRRIPIAMFFTLGLPLIMLVLFNALFGSNRIDTPDGSWSSAQFYTGGLAAFTAVSATFTNLANMVPLRRDEGVLKRWRGTPLPTWVYLGGFICSAVVIAFVGVIVMLALGVVAYDLDISSAKLPAAFVTFLVGVASQLMAERTLTSSILNSSS
jgi:ABC-2 type transport system permease protein